MTKHNNTSSETTEAAAMATLTSQRPPADENASSTTASHPPPPPPSSSSSSPHAPVAKMFTKYDQSTKENIDGTPPLWIKPNSPRHFKKTSADLKSPRPSEEELAMFAHPLPLLRDVSNQNEQKALFIKKLELCSVKFDFTGPYANAFEKEKEIKRKTLLELVEFAETKSGVFTPETYGPVITMITCNIFRSLPPKVQPACQAEAPVEELEEEPRPDPAWPHLLPVYTLFLEFVVSRDTDPKLALEYIDKSLIIKLLQLFDSDDPREREYLRTILHRIYAKFMPLRQFIRIAIANVVFHPFVFETERQNGIAELLEILGSIINGFSLPLKQEHKEFFHRAILPLHKPRTLVTYHKQLLYCMVQFIQKDTSLAVPAITTLLKYWPVTSAKKETLFLHELEEILERVKSEVIEPILKPMFHRLAKCMSSKHCDVAELALVILGNNDTILDALERHREELMPIIMGPLIENSFHWSTNVHELTQSLQKLLLDMDPVLYEERMRRHCVESDSEKISRQVMNRRWSVLEDRAGDNNNNNNNNEERPLSSSRDHHRRA
jgi:serine/threonine-protein phosphatase 2A regulatory subunit B'